MSIGLNRRGFLGLTALAVLVANVDPARSKSKLATIRKKPTGNNTISPPSENGGRLFFSGDRCFGAVDIETFEDLWRHDNQENSPMVFRPRISGNVSVFGGAQGFVAHDVSTGALLWKYEARIQTGVPLAADDFFCFGDGHEIVSLDLRNGKELWRHACVVDTLAAYAPVFASNMVIAGPGDGRLYALDAATGAPHWVLDRHDEWQYLRQLRVEGNILVAGSYKEKLFGISIDDGRALWEFNAGNFINSHMVSEGTAFLWSPTGFLYAVSVNSGRVLWRHQTTDYDGSGGNWAPMMAELVVHGGQILALDMRNVLHVLDAGSGEPLGNFQIDARIRHAILPVSGHGLVFPASTGELVLTGFPLA